jgi:hypothetical protein
MDHSMGFEMFGEQDEELPRFDSLFQESPDK